MMGEELSSVPPGFRFHPTDEELLYYYLRKKVSYEAIEVDVIREVDLNKLEPWDLKDKCRIGSGHENEWYFFSHKDKKYPTGSRTNRATSAGFWKATGRDKAIHMGAPNSNSNSNSKMRIGMRKTLVFYTGRAPHGQKTDWIMHEYRLQLDDNNPQEAVHEDGWVVCRVFKKKSSHKLPELVCSHTKALLDSSTSAEPTNNNNNNNHMQEPIYNYYNSFDTCMQLPQLVTPDDQQLSLNATASTGAADECPKLISCGGVVLQQDWSFLNRLLTLDQQSGSLPDHHLIPTKNFSFPLFPPYPYPPHRTSASATATDLIKFSNFA